MSYQLLVEFRGGNSPSTEDAHKVLREFDQSLASSGGSVLQSIDSLSGDSFSIDLGRSNVIRFDVPYTSTFRSVTRAYNLAWAFADRFGGTVKDPQLGGSPSLDLARREWDKNRSGGDLVKIFQGNVPADLKIKIKQRRGAIRQEVEIRGSDIEIKRTVTSRSVHYSLPILSLGPVQESRVPNPRGALLGLVGAFLLVVALAIGGGLIAAIMALASVACFISIFPVAYGFKRRVLGFPGRGGNLLLEAASPSKKEVEQFLSSIDRVRFALIRSQTRRGAPTGSEADSMRVA